MVDILVVGAGPAGLAAALAARRHGATVTILDSADHVGGQYWRHLPACRPSRDEGHLHHGWRLFGTMRDQLASDSGCRTVTSAQVWAIEPGGSTPAVVHALVGPADSTGRERLALSPDAIVLATGAHDRTLPFPGWDLPGVFTAGAAQALAKGERIAVGSRVLVAGAGPFLLPVAASLVQTGSRVLGVLEANPLRSLARGWCRRPWELVGAGKKGPELAGYVASQLRNRIPYRTGRAIAAAHGSDRLTSVTMVSVDRRWAPIPGTEQEVAVDAVCVSHGFTPRLELAIAAGCDLTANRFVAVTDDQHTSVAGVYAAGEITGIGGVDLSLAEGRIAGHVAAGGGVGDSDLARAVSQRRVYRGFAQRLEAAHGIQDGWKRWLADETVVCRCEEVTYGGLRTAARTTGSTSLRSLKLTSRAGLGICQGRVCGRTVEQLLADETPGRRLRDGVLSDHRPIAAPVRLGDLAAAYHRAHPDQ